MFLGVVAWCFVGILFLAIAMSVRKEETPVSFWNRKKAVTADEITDVPAYNRAVSTLFIAFACGCICLGLLFSLYLWAALYLSLSLVWPALLCVGYQLVYRKFRK